MATTEYVKWSEYLANLILDPNDWVKEATDQDLRKTEVRSSNEAKLHNAEILRQHDNNLDEVIRAHTASTISYGMEFRPVPVLETVFGRQSGSCAK